MTTQREYDIQNRMKELDVENMRLKAQIETMKSDRISQIARIHEGYAARFQELQSENSALKEEVAALKTLVPTQPEPVTEVTTLDEPLTEEKA